LRYKNTKKVPLFITTALFFATPICLAEAANANINGADGSYSALQPGLQQLQKPLTQGSMLLKQSFLGQTPQTIRTFKFPILSSEITLDDVIFLQSRLTQAESQLRTLKSTQPRNPALKPQIDALIQQAEQSVLNLSKALEAADSLYKKYLAAAQKAEQAATTLQTAAEAEALALEQFNTAKAAYETAQETLRLTTQSHTQNLATLSEKLANQSAAATNKAYALDILNTATLNLEEKTAAHTTTQSLYDQALQAKNSAQEAYDTLLIPDPTWTAPTYQKENIRIVENTRTVEVKTLVPNTTTTLQEQVIPNILFNSDFASGTSGWSGVNAGWQGSNPALIDGEIIFSYQNQTVSQGLFSGPFQNATLTLSADWFNNDSNTGRIDNYSMTVEAKDINQNTVGSATYNSTGAHDWDRKSVSLVATGPVSYITVSFSGIDNGFWYGVYGPHFKNPSLQISHGQMVTETTYEEVITYEEETYYTYETYYTTELVTTEGTLQVQINEGGQATFNAPEGAVFVSSNLRYEAKDRPTCGKDIAPQLTGLSTITIQALNSVWGDPCGGWQKHITGTLTYLGQPTAPLIKNPALLIQLNDAEAELLAANNALTAASSELSAAQTQKQTANSQHQSMLSEYETASEAVSIAELGVTSAETEKTTAGTQLQEAQSTYQVADTSYKAAQTQTLTATSAKQEAEAETEAVSTSYQRSVVTAKSIPAPTETFAQVEELQTKEPEPEALPEEITAESVLEIDLSQVDPTQMTEEQAEELVAAALVIFETAVEGSPEYEQALDALYLAAEQDDIVLDPALAAIPGLAAATELVNFLGNAGADMSPKVREESEKIVVTAVVAAGAAIQSAAAAASTASGTTRRIGN
jgi:hypothetical protein